MNHENAPFEIHVHGDVKIRPEVGLEALQEALRPLWQYAGVATLADGAESLYEEEPGLRFDAINRLLQMCWTVRGDEDFRAQLDDLCMNLNEISAEGAPIEVTFYDTTFDDDDDDDDLEEREARDDFVLLFVGPTPGAIMRVQRDVLVEDVMAVMARHFEEAELGGVVAAIDQLFEGRRAALAHSLDMSRPQRGAGGRHAPRRSH
ncbi:MAG: hypothetical protein J6T92_02455 [Ottowia sp.]|nr:hypothetical protein [Ottowia sp.]